MSAGMSAGTSAVTLNARRTDGFDARLADTLGQLQSAAKMHPGAIVQATSLGAEDMVITDLIARHALPITVATLDTGFLHAETLRLIPKIDAHYGTSSSAQSGSPLSRSISTVITIHAMVQQVSMAAGE